jgi:signal transduction histidine kinase/CheY-like chemotaxis protein
MNESASSFKSELRTSPRLMIAILIIMALIVSFVSDSQRNPLFRSRLSLLMLLIFSMAAVLWIFEGWKPLLARWSMIIGLIALVHLGNAWLAIPGCLTLMAIPTGLAAAFISLSAATVVAIAETTLLLLLPRAIATGSAVAIALIVIWAMLGIMVAVYRPVYQVARWVQEYYQMSQRSLEEARNHKAEVKQALSSLAHANQQLAMAAERMAALRAIAEEAQKAKAMFVAKVSHEFRTPLNMIIGLVELMVETPQIYAVELPPEMEKDLGVVLRNCRHLSGLISDVLDLTRTETGHMTLHREWVDLAGIIDEAITAVLPLVQKKGLTLQTATPEDLPAVYCDRTRIRQVILNLVSNAARFTEEGAISINVATREQHLVVNVTDTGPGIAAEDTERIFEPFFQGTSEMWRDKAGSGLGLSVSQQFINLHGGRLWLESKVGVGSSFSFELPISPPVEHVAAPGHQIREDWIWREDAFRTSRAGLADQPRRPCVIVCDETGGLWPELGYYLDDVDFVQVGDLSEAKLDTQEYPADAVVLNAAASDDLLTLAEKACLGAQSTPIIGCFVPARNERAIASSSIGYLIKPVSRAALEEAIRGVGRTVRRVLLVDDDPDILRLFTRMLHVCDERLEVEIASNGEQALDRLQSAPFDLLLLDIVMPDMDGWQMLERLRTDRRTEDLPVILLSARDPIDQPQMSNFLLAAIRGGISIRKLLRCSLELSALLLTPDGELDPTPPQTAGAG